MRPYFSGFLNNDYSMKMIIDNFDDSLALRSELSSLQMKGYHLLYRGHASNSFELLSMVGRKIPINGNLLDSEKRCFQDYKDYIADRSWMQYKVSSYNEDLFYMSIGRHLGLDCRLLDWTARLETALFFASADEGVVHENGHLWIMIYKGSVDDANAKSNPFEIKDVTLIKEAFLAPPNMTMENFPLGEQRRFAQNGFFTIVPTDLLTTPLDHIPLNNMILKKVEITANAKKNILSALSKCYEDYLYKRNSIIETDIKRINSMYFE